MKPPKATGCRVERILWRVLVAAVVGLVLVVVAAVVLEVYAIPRTCFSSTAAR